MNLTSPPCALYYSFVIVRQVPSSLPLASLVACVLSMGSLSSAASLEESNAQAYAHLVSSLRQEIAILKAMEDRSTADEGLEALTKIKAEMRALSTELGDSQSFSLYVIRTEERKTEMNHLLMALTVERQRIQKSGCFDVPELQALLSKQPE